MRFQGKLPGKASWTVIQLKNQIKITICQYIKSLKELNILSLWTTH